MSDDNSGAKISSGVADAVLSGMFQQIKSDYNIDDTRVDDLIESFSRKMTHVPIAARQHWRGNVPSDLKKMTMTWKTFVRGMRALGAEGFDLDFSLRHSNAFVTMHKFIKILPKANEPEDDDDESLSEGEKPATDLRVFFMQIMNELGIQPQQFDSLLAAYMKRTTRPGEVPSKSSTKGNLKKALLDNRLSWANFVKGLVVLNIVQFEFKITLKFKRGRQSSHRRLIYLPDYKDDKETVND